jgi:hypothetical protein
MMKRRGKLKVGIHWIGYRFNSSDESEQEHKEEGEDTDGENERNPQMFAGPTVGIRKTDRDDVLASPTKNTRKRKSTIPVVDSPAMATRGKRGNK